MAPHRRLPLAPVIAYLGARTEIDAAAWVGVSRRTWARWLAEGGCPWYRADAIATAAGTHPYLIWGDDWATLSPARNAIWSQHRDDDE